MQIMVNGLYANYDIVYEYIPRPELTGLRLFLAKRLPIAITKRLGLIIETPIVVFDEPPPMGSVISYVVDSDSG